MNTMDKEKNIYFKKGIFRNILLVLILVSLVGCGFNEQPNKVEVKENMNNYEKYEVALENTMKLDNFALIQQVNYEIYENNQIVDGINMKMDYKFLNAHNSKVNSDNHYSILGEDDSTIFEAKYWYDGEYQYIDSGDEKEKKKTSPNDFNKEIDTVLSSSLVNLGKLENSLIKNEHDNYIVELGYENKGLIETYIKRMDLFDETLYKINISTVNKFVIKYTIENSIIVKEEIEFDYIMDNCQFKGFIKSSINESTIDIKLPKNLDTYEEKN